MTSDVHPDLDHIPAAGLTHLQQVRWFLVDVRGFTNRAVAELQGVTEGAVKLSVREARRKLRQAKQEAA